MELMDLPKLGPEAEECVRRILGYLNYSSGASDPKFIGDVNWLFGQIAKDSPPRKKKGRPRSCTLAAWQVLGQIVRQGLERVGDGSDAFPETHQAQSVVRLTFENVLPAYKQHHADLLFHQDEVALFQPLFIARVFEAVLSEGGPWEQTERVVTGSLRRLNDFLGHRPVAVLENRRKLEPYEHESIRPVPLYIDRVGITTGRYGQVVETALEILRATDSRLLRQAWFDPDLLDELALDVRAFDFDHPINRRPNYHFGGWDPLVIDNRGNYRRFVLQQVTLDALSKRIEKPGKLLREEVHFEAAAILAGTMLMGSGITGSGPDSHDSNTTLMSLLPRIAGYRDTFYLQLMERLPRSHAQRLRDETDKLKQPFGAARQDLNQRLSERRALQVQHVRLSRLFAGMGYTDAAIRQAHVIPVAAARMRCEIDCRLTTAHLNIDRRQLDAAAGLITEIEDLLHAAISCGAIVDPWNILGFGAQYGLFPAVENSVHDHRVDELIDLMNDIFGLYARLENEAAAAGQHDLKKSLSDNMRALATWWDQFASTEVGEVYGFSGHQVWESAALVADALGAWHEAGTAAGDVAFWRRYVTEFRSPKAYALLIEALLEQRDPVASMALLMDWLSSADEVPLMETDYSFYILAVRWMQDLWKPPERPASARPVPTENRWRLAKKFLDFFEANAGDYWHVPKLEIAGDSSQHQADELDDEVQDDDRGDQLFGAAYEDVTYRDTTDDGFEGEMLEGGYQTSDFELSLEAERIGDRTAFIVTLAGLWKLAAAVPMSSDEEERDRDEVLAGWLGQANTNRRELLALLDSLHRYRIPLPRGTHDALIEYDRRRGIKEMLFERIIAATVETEDARRFIIAAMERYEPPADLEDWEIPVDKAFRAVFRGDQVAVREDWSALLEVLSQQPILYVPTTRGGNPHRIVSSRFMQKVLFRLLEFAPRLGLLRETYRLLETIRVMERNHPAGYGAITEYDLLFETGCKGIIGCLVASSERWQTNLSDSQDADEQADVTLVDCVERAAELLLLGWLAHSRHIRISVLETAADKHRWNKLQVFIQAYGKDLFTQQFMNFGNLRAILHQGVDQFIEALENEPNAEENFRFIEDLDLALPRDQATELLELIIEAIVENYPEYVDYNSTTTQSDNGELLYTLMDFLRVEASYDRVAWNLKPVIFAHEVLVRRGRTAAAALWRQAVAERTGSVADNHMDRYRRLSRKYGMKLPAVVDRLRERFVQPLAVDRLCALVRPAVEEFLGGKETLLFKEMEREAEGFIKKPGGVGLDVPAWLESLEEEIRKVRSKTPTDNELPDPFPEIPQVFLSLEEVHRQMNAWEEEQESLDRPFP
jgi:hypothetical protein